MRVESDIRGGICIWDLGLKYCYLSREKPQPIVGHNFIADEIISATLFDFSHNTAKQIYCIKWFLFFSLVNWCENSSTKAMLKFSQNFWEMY